MKLMHEGERESEIGTLLVEDPDGAEPVIRVGTISYFLDEPSFDLVLSTSIFWSGDETLLVCRATQKQWGITSKKTVGYDFKAHQRLSDIQGQLLKQRGGEGKSIPTDFGTFRRVSHREA